MLVTGTSAAARIVERAKRDRRGALVFTIGTGCCESTAPFLYEDFWPGPDQEPVGEVAGVPVYAPEYLRTMYPGDDGVVIDVEEGFLAESLSIETEYSARFVLRDGAGGVVAGQDITECPPERGAVPSHVSALRARGPQPLPAALQQLRMR
ncbi:MAG TPA: DUF779 domain-containing protein [Acidimicrobiia bacterium]|nr:DUF779 domain-containing protein [Acidimicrobiia bacterium]